MRRQANERRCCEDLVGQRIHELAEISNQILPPGDLAIEPVSESGDNEQSKRGCEAVGKSHREADDKRCGKSEPR